MTSWWTSSRARWRRRRPTRPSGPPATSPIARVVHWVVWEVAGVSKATISRIWRTFGLQTHRLETFKLSADPQFVEKVRDIVGLYLNPPDHALVLCLDEKS